MSNRDKSKIIVNANTVLDNLPEFLLLKLRRGGTVVLSYGSESNAKELFKVLKLKFENNDNLRGSSIGVSEMNISLYGSSDPDPSFINGDYKKFLDAVVPKPRRCNPFGLPIIFGTGCSLDGSDYFRNVMDLREDVVNIPFYNKLYPVTPEDAFRKKGNFMLDPVSDVKGFVDRIRESIDGGKYMDPKDIVDKLSKR